MLHEIQKNFKDHLLRPLAETEAIEPTFSALLETNSIALQDRLKIYHGNVIGGISKAFTSNFPLLEKLVGEDFLLSLARGFVLQNPPRSGCLFDYGAGFDLFIAGHPQTKALPYLAEIAKLELAIHHANHAQDDHPLTPESLASMPQDTLADLILSLRESCTLLRCTYPVMAIREFCLNPELQPPDIDTKTQVFLLVYRPQRDIHFISLEPAEYIFLENIKSGETLGHALTQAIENNATFEISSVLQKHLLLATFKSL